MTKICRHTEFRKKFIIIHSKAFSIVGTDHAFMNNKGPALSATFNIYLYEQCCKVSLCISTSYILSV